MARPARRMSESGYFHVIIRGNAKQIIFEASDDYRFFLNRIEKFSAETGVGVCAYCLMENHVHMLLHDTRGMLPEFMKKLGVSYVRFFNWKYERSGHLFQDRYKSEPIEDDSYFLSVLCYILNNPVKAGLGGPAEYLWSSYNAYDGSSFIDTELIRGLLPTWEEYEELVMLGSKAGGSELEASKKDDKWAKEFICREFGVESCTVIQGFERKKRDEAVMLMLQKGLSERQIERLTGISRYIIRKIAW